MNTNEEQDGFFSDFVIKPIPVKTRGRPTKSELIEAFYVTGIIPSRTTMFRIKDGKVYGNIVTVLYFYRNCINPLNINKKRVKELIAWWRIDFLGFNFSTQLSFGFQLSTCRKANPYSLGYQLGKEVFCELNTEYNI